MRDTPDMAQLDHPVRQETKRPTAPTRRGAAAGQGDEVGLLVAVEHPRPSWQGATNEDTLETALDEGATHAMDGDRSQIQGDADLLVRPCRPEVAAVRLQEDARPSQFPGRRLAAGDQRFQLLTLFDR